MGRNRPLAQAKSPNTTQNGYDLLKYEKQALWYRQHKVSQALAAAPLQLSHRSLFDLRNYGYVQTN
jgi:hypothetical protein